MDQAAEQGHRILPPQATAWSREHLRLHRLLLRQPALLPQGATLLLAISGGQDSMALLGLLLGLRRLHHWKLLLWHGDHGWRKESSHQAAELAQWCKRAGLTLLQDTQQEVSPTSGNREAQARQWRYDCLSRRALQHQCSHVVTGHTGSDRAETLLLNLARGSHRRGLASLRSQRPLGDGLMLARPLLIFSRSETAQVCRNLELPLWLDPSNSDLSLSRNRLRHQVLPVLEELHPGATRRLCGTAERLSQEQDAAHEWHQIALQWLCSSHGDGPGDGIDRQRLNQLQPINRAVLLNHWLSSTTSSPQQARALETLMQRLEPGRPPGQMDLARGWQLRWDRTRLELIAPPPSSP